MSFWKNRFIDLSSELGYELVLIDNWWDSRIGREKIEELAQYAASRNIGICLWYNSNGFWRVAMVRNGMWQLSMLRKKPRN